MFESKLPRKKKEGLREVGSIKYQGVKPAVECIVPRIRTQGTTATAHPFPHPKVDDHKKTKKEEPNKLPFVQTN